MHVKNLWLVLMCCLFFLSITGTAQTIQTITDKKTILIGEQVKLKIKATLPAGHEIPFNKINIPDSIPHFEVVDAGKADTVSVGSDAKAIEQTLVLTSFDSGRWVFPSLTVSFAQGDFRTDSFIVDVSYSPADSTNQLRDIKPIINVSVTDYTWYYIIGGTILLLLIAFLLYRNLKKKKTDKPTITTPASKLSAYDEAMAALKDLQRFVPVTADEIKNYHSKLAAIFKQYFGRKQQKNLAVKTTSDLLVRMKEAGLAGQTISDLAIVLRCTDAVKFAKYLPMATESQDSLQKLKAVINAIEHPNQNT